MDMQRKLLVGAAVIVLAAAAWVIYSGNQREEDTANDESFEVFASVSFMCSFGTDFIAEFPESFDRVSIIENGETVRTLERADGTGTRFVNSEYEYLFAGEEVNVLRTSDQFADTCMQPFDPNNAPFNFGDAAEGGGSEQPDPALVVGESIQGTWRSLDDEAFTREFRDDGTMVDRYDGEVTSTSSWQTFADVAPSEVSFPIEPNTVYIRALEEDGMMLHFKVVKLTPEELEMIYLEGSGTLRFSFVE